MKRLSVGAGSGLRRRATEHDEEGARVVFGEILERLVVHFGVAGFSHGRECGAAAGKGRRGNAARRRQLRGVRGDGNAQPDGLHHDGQGVNRQRRVRRRQRDGVGLGDIPDRQRQRRRVAVLKGRLQVGGRFVGVAFQARPPANSPCNRPQADVPNSCRLRLSPPVVAPMPLRRLNIV